MTPNLVYQYLPLKLIYLIQEMSAQWMKVYEQELQYLNKYLSHPKNVNRYEDTIYGQSAIKKINKQFNRLQEKYQFRHVFMSFEDMKQDESVRSAKRLIKMRFKCKNMNCSEFKRRQSKDQKSSEIQRNWTSYNGLIDFQFIFTFFRAQSRQVPNLTYTLKIYRQKCQTCKQWGKSGLIQSCCEQLINTYSLLIQNLLILFRKNSTDIPWGIAQKIGVKPRMNDGSYTSHMKALCEACRKGECPRFFYEGNSTVKQEYEVKREVKEEEDYPIFIASQRRR